MDGDLPKNAAFFNYLMNMGDYCYAAQQETKQVIANLTTELNTQKELVSHLKQENDGLKKELNETTLRLSTIMGMKITNDNPDIADLSDDYRPTNLLAMFSELYDNEWTDAYMLLTKEMSEADAIKWLLAIINDIKQYCEAQQQAKSDEVRRTLLVNEGDTIPDFVLKYIKENRKKRANSLLNTEYQEYQAILSQRTLEWRTIALHLSAYTQECFRVCYLMSIQDPPVVFDTLDITHGDTKNYKAYTKVGKKVDFVVWPCLRLYKDGRVLSKGVVQFIPLKESADVRSATVSVGREIFGFGEGRKTQTKQNENAEFRNQQRAFGNESNRMRVESAMEFTKYDVESNKIADAKDKSSIEHGPDDNRRTDNQMSRHDCKEGENLDHPSSASAESCVKTTHENGLQIPETKNGTVEENASHRLFEKQTKHNEDAESLYQQGASEKESDHIDLDSKMEFPQSDKGTRPRFSASMGIKATDDNPDIADLRDENMPTKQAQMFSELYDNAWTDAYELLKEKMSETEAIKWLLVIIIQTKQYCEAQQQAKSDVVRRALLVNEEDTIPDFVLKYIKENRKKRATSLLETEYQEYKVRLSQSTVEWKDIACYLSAYTQECFRVCYLMSIQDPPMVFDTLDFTHVDLLDTKNYKAYTMVGEKVDFMVWPCLKLCKGGRVLSKGVVQFIMSPNKSANVRSASIGEGPTSLGFVERQNTQMKQNDDAEFPNQQGASGKENDDMEFECQEAVAKVDKECDQISGAKYESSIGHGRDDNKRTDNRMSSHDGNTTENLSHKSSESAESCEETTSGTS